MIHFQVTHPWWLLALPFAAGWTVWLSSTSGTQLAAWRRWLGMALRLLIVAAMVLALAGLQWLRPLEGMNILFLLDRSDSIPNNQQTAAREYVNRAVRQKRPVDQAGAVVFGSQAGIESSVGPVLDLEKINAVVPTDRTDLGAAIRLGTAAFPEYGQKRLVLISDGNQNLGDAMAAALSAHSLGVSIDVLPLGLKRSGDVSLEKVSVPGQLKKGQTFDVKIFAQADHTRPATLRLFRNNQLLGQQRVELEAGKNLFTFPQTLDTPDFYQYDVQLDARGDSVPQNNRATAFADVRGNPRVLVVSSDPAEDATLVQALRRSQLEVKSVGISGFPDSLAAMESYDTIVLSNVAAGDLGNTLMRLLESAVRDFGVGLVCVGGDQTYAAGGYKGTPLEETLPLSMELSSKKVLPNGALVMIMHGMEFMNGNQIARQVALGVLDTLSPRDELGIVLWDGSERWLFPLSKVGDKKKMAREIAGMRQGDLPTFENVMRMAYAGLKKSHANLKHIIVFSDGDPAAPSAALMQQIVSDRITVSSVLIAGHSGPQVMQQIAEQGRGRFYRVLSANRLPQIFIKEASVILKSAISEQPFKPRVAVTTEPVRGIGAGDYPILDGYVATTPKSRAEIPLLTDKGDPLLAHWQFGLGRAVAFTSDAKAKWAKNWLGWSQYRQFWSQVVHWSLRRLENTDFTTDISSENGQGVLTVEALDEKGNYRNFLDLRAVVVNPQGKRQNVVLEQTGPGHYEARFSTKQVGAYLLNLMNFQNGKLRGSQVLGTSVNYSPEFRDTEPNRHLLEQIAAATGGKVLSPDLSLDNPFTHDRTKTFQPRDLWEWLLEFAIILFPLDVGLRRIQLDREEWVKATQTLRRWLFFWSPPPQSVEPDVSLASLLARRGEVRSRQSRATGEVDPLLFQPRKPAAPAAGPASGKQEQPGEESGGAEPPKKEEPEATTSRLLEAKRRAQQRRKH